MPNVSRPFVIAVLSFTLVACGSDDADPASPLRTGVFLDSAVEGLNYATATMSGKTNATGEFNFNAGETITFSIGGYELPSVQAASIVTPLDIFGATDTEDARVADLSRLLQSMDADANPNNGISLPMNVESITSDTIIDFGEPSFDTQALSLLAQINESQDQLASQLVDSNTATAHLNQTLVDNNLVSDDCTSDHPFVGRTAELSTLEHGVSGTISIMNDCVIEVTNFNYDGGGPQVFFYGAVDQDYITDAFPIGNRLNGQQWVNDTLLLAIPEGKTLDDFNSLSVWCADFSINFGDAYFGEQ